MRVALVPLLAAVGYFGTHLLLGLLMALGLLGGTAVAQEPVVVANVRADVPQAHRPWPLRFVLAVPEGTTAEELEGGFLSVRHPTTGAALATQVTAHLRRFDGTVRSVHVAALVPAGLPAAPAVFEVWREVGFPVSPALTPLVQYALLGGGEWTLAAEGVEGEVYVARLGQSIEVVRRGPVELVWRTRAALVPVLGGESPDLLLPHLGVVTVDVRAWSGVDALDVRVLWEQGVVDAPLAWTLFRRVTLRAPAGTVLQTVHPTAGAGEVRHVGQGALLDLVAPMGSLHGALPHSAKLWWLAASPPGQEVTARAVVAGAGWGWASGPWALDSAPGLADGRRLPTDWGVPRTVAAARVRAELDQWTAARAGGAPLEGSQGANSWRHPAGAGYGGVTGGQGVGARWWALEASGDAAATHALVGARTENRLDRTRASLVHLDGRSWRLDQVQATWNLALSPEPLYDATWINCWPSPYSQDPLGATKAQPAYRASTAELWGAALAADKALGTDDLQHWTRGVRDLWAWAELFADPTAELLVSRLATTIRADLWDGGSGSPDFYVSTMRWLAARDGEGLPMGRDLAWAGCHVALAFALGDEAERGRLQRWLDLWADAYVTGPLPSGWHNRFDSGKERTHAEQARAKYGGTAPQLAVGQVYQEAFGIEAAAWVAGSAVDEPTAGALRIAAERAAGAIARLAWDAAAKEPAYRIAVVDLATGAKLATREEVAATYSSDLHHFGAPELQGWHVPLALAGGLDDPEVLARLDRYLGLPAGAGWSARLAEARRRAPESPENWAGLLAVLEERQAP
jgi:hypothetical protein